MHMQTYKHTPLSSQSLPPNPETLNLAPWPLNVQHLRTYDGVCQGMHSEPAARIVGREGQRDGGLVGEGEGDEGRREKGKRE